MCSSKATKGDQYAESTRITGFVWISRVIQLTTSTVSSRVPMPPGSEMKASALSYMAMRLSCMSRVSIILATPGWWCSRSTRNDGMIPVT